MSFLPPLRYFHGHSSLVWDALPSQARRGQTPLSCGDGASRSRGGSQSGLLAPAEKTSHLEEPTGFAVGASQGRRPPRGQDQLAL